MSERNQLNKEKQETKRNENKRFKTKSCDWMKSHGNAQMCNQMAIKALKFAIANGNAQKNHT